MRNRNFNKLHSLSPYIGKIRPELSNHLITNYSTDKNSFIYDPFCGSGSVLLEGWLNGYNVVGTDLNYYASILSLGKLNPPKNLTDALNKLNYYYLKIKNKTDSKTKKIIDPWVKQFFHPKTLKELMKWFAILSKNNEWFLLSCLLGILHHQRPGFLSYPCSHGVPYLRDKKFPLSDFPELYEYRDVYERLKLKIERSIKDIPEFDLSKKRIIFNKCATSTLPEVKRVKTIITSPPYMKSLTYARDNRLRLWFLNVKNWQALDQLISPSKDRFKTLMQDCFKSWSKLQRKNDKCIIIIGDILFDRKNNMTLSDLIEETAYNNGYQFVEKYNDIIPEKNKFLKNKSSIKAETISIFNKG